MIKRIVVLCPELLGTGGVQEASRLTASAIAEIISRYGWKATFLGLNDPRGANPPLSSGHGPLQVQGFSRSKARFIGAALFAARDNCRIVLSLHPNLAVPALWMRRIAPSLKRIVMSHGIEVWNPLPKSRRRALVGSDFVLAPSHFTLSKLSAVQSIPNDKLRLLPWPLNPEFLRMATNPGYFPLPEGFPQGQVILTLARWSAAERYKGLDELLRALALLPDSLPAAHLAVIGTGDDLPRLRQLSADLGVNDRTHFFERLSREEIGACYARADIFALASTGEGFGIVFLEAMAFGKPIVAASFGGTTDLVEQNVNGLLVPPRDVPALAGALGRLLRDAALRSQLGKQGAGIVRTRYQFNSFQNELENILIECGLE